MIEGVYICIQHTINITQLEVPEKCILRVWIVKCVCWNNSGSMGVGVGGTNTATFATPTCSPKPKFPTPTSNLGSRAGQNHKVLVNLTSPKSENSSDLGFSFLPSFEKGEIRGLAYVHLFGSTPLVPSPWTSPPSRWADAEH